MMALAAHELDWATCKCLVVSCVSSTECLRNRGLLGSMENRGRNEISSFLRMHA